MIFAIVFGTQLSNGNSDRDSLSDGDEALVLLTNPLLADTDGDGLRDNIEIENGLDPNFTDTDNNDIVDSDEDLDKDGLINIEEQNIGTRLDLEDTDGDLVDDARDLCPLENAETENGCPEDTETDITSELVDIEATEEATSETADIEVTEEVVVEETLSETTDTDTTDATAVPEVTAEALANPESDINEEVGEDAEGDGILLAEDQCWHYRACRLSL